MFTKSTKALFISMVLVASVAAPSQAGTVSYLLEISSGLAHTSGGFSGHGMGDLAMQGMFRLNIDTATHSAALEDVSISFVDHPLLPIHFDWDSLVGTITQPT